MCSNNTWSKSIVKLPFGVNEPHCKIFDNYLHILWGNRQNLKKSNQHWKIPLSYVLKNQHDVHKLRKNSKLERWLSC